MKKQLLIISMLLFSLLGFSQGIEFESGTWKEILEKAQRINKPIFVDVYTSWCAPCKTMSKNIFPLTEVGKAYNANFICYQLDAEKGEGIEIADKYEVKAFPAYLFIKADGALFYNALGSMDANNFIALSNKALAEMNDPKPITVWEKEYATRKSDPKFILDYMNKRSMLRMSNTKLFDEYLKLIPEEELTSDIIVKMYTEEGKLMTVNSFAFENLLKYKEKYFGKLFGYVQIYLLAGVMNSVRDAAKSKNEQLLTAAMKVYDQLPNISFISQKDEIYMEYYQRTGETDNYLKHATNFGNNYLMKISPDSINEKDRIFAQRIEKEINSGALVGLDSAQIAHLKEISAHAERNKISENLNNIAWKVFEMVSDKRILSNALSWSKRSLEIYPNNAFWLDTYANLLYKLGQSEEAIAKEEEALRHSSKNDTKGFEETLRKMKAKEKTWKN
nr:thioredoxin family protein [uncultured Bacteroides sp.]